MFGLSAWNHIARPRRRTDLHRRALGVVPVLRALLLVHAAEVHDADVWERGEDRRERCEHLQVCQVRAGFRQGSRGAAGADELRERPRPQAAKGPVRSIKRGPGFDHGGDHD
jgi:hypothetical protein